MDQPRHCIHCGESRPEHLRPYGPGGTDVCMACAMATPEREAETERQFAAQLGSAEGAAAREEVPVVIGDDVGPRPATDAETNLAAELLAGEGGHA